MLVALMRSPRRTQAMCLRARESEFVFRSASRRNDCTIDRERHMHCDHAFVISRTIGCAFNDSRRPTTRGVDVYARIDARQRRRSRDHAIRVEDHPWGPRILQSDIVAVSAGARRPTLIDTRTIRSSWARTPSVEESSSGDKIPMPTDACELSRAPPCSI
jgi:hypothetical protein